MSSICKKKLMYTRAKADPILAAVMQDIHRTAQASARVPHLRTVGGQVGPEVP